MISSIAKQLCRPLEIDTRLQNVASWYLLSLSLDTARHDLTHASQLSGLNVSQFSRFLSEHPALACASLLSLVVYRSRKIRRLEKKASKLFEKSPWSVAIIIDSTLHGRSSHVAENTQRFNHGGGFIFGHQWTNVVLLLGGCLIPLPPIEFLTKKECRNRDITYQKEPDRVVTYLTELHLDSFIGYLPPEEVVVLMDSGYDIKKIETCILSKGWAFVNSIKSNRSCRTMQQGENTNWMQIRDIFNRFKRVAPKTTVGFKKRTARNKTKRKIFSTKRLEGDLKGVHHPVTLLYSKLKGNSDPKYLACSRNGLPTWLIIKTYDLRFLIECFHRDTKQHLGLMDAGLKNFESVKTHVHWVYCAYILLQDFKANDTAEKRYTTRDKQKQVRWLYETELWKSVIQASTRFGGANQVRNKCLENIRLSKAA